MSLPWAQSQPVLLSPAFAPSAVPRLLRAPGSGLPLWLSTPWSRSRESPQHAHRIPAPARGRVRTMILSMRKRPNYPGNQSYLAFCSRLPSRSGRWGEDLDPRQATSPQDPQQGEGGQPPPPANSANDKVVVSLGDLRFQRLDADLADDQGSDQYAGWELRSSPPDQRLAFDLGQLRGTDGRGGDRVVDEAQASWEVEERHALRA